jgi:hypothetical protein
MQMRFMFFVFCLIAVLLYVFQQIHYRSADTVYLNKESHFVR